MMSDREALEAIRHELDQYSEAARLDVLPSEADRILRRKLRRILDETVLPLAYMWTDGGAVMWRCPYCRTEHSTLGVAYPVDYYDANAEMTYENGYVRVEAGTKSGECGPDVYYCPKCCGQVEPSTGPGVEFDVEYY